MKRTDDQGPAPYAPRGAGAARGRPATVPKTAAWPAAGAGEHTLVAQLVGWLSRRIDERLLGRGTRVPSIRAMALERGVSRATVVAAYERLVASGRLESRRGSGFYVCEQPQIAGRPRPRSDRPLDVGWLLRNMFRNLPAERMPGSGLPPPEWLDRQLLSAQIRSIGRQSGAGVLDYGDPQGFLPLRNLLALKLGGQEVAADPHQILMTSGATQAFDLIARHLIEPGDTVLVDDPAWFLMFGLFTSHGAAVVGVPRLSDGPDLSVLEALLERHRPRFYVVHSVLHNPTSSSLSAAKAYQILKLAEQYDFTLVEDDVYGDLHPGAAPGRGLAAARLASLDQLRRVIYVGSFSKTLGANLRVGFLAAAADRVALLADLKLLTTLTSPELGERIVYRILSEGHYRKHLDRLRGRLDAVREPTQRRLEAVGFRVAGEPQAGIFLWARMPQTDAALDSNQVAAAMLEQGYVLAPGSLFSPDQASSPWMRFNIATSQDPGMLAALERVLAGQAGRARP